MAVQLTLVEDFEALRSAGDEWNDLARRSVTATVFQTFEWNHAWWRALGAEASLLVLLARDEGRLVGIAPLMVTRQRILGRRRRVVEFIGTHAADYSDVLLEPGYRAVAAVMLNWLLVHAARWDLLQLVNLPEGSPLLALLPSAFAGGSYVVDVHPLYECPTRLLRDRPADLQQARKKSIRSGLNQLARRGPVAFEVHSTADAIGERLDAFFRQHIARWAGTPTPSFFSDERQRRFYRELARLMAPRGWVVFSAVTCAGEPVSLHFGFHHEERVYVIKYAFDPRYLEFGPGMLQLKFLLEYAIEAGAAELDFTTGQEPYKYRFSNHARVNHFARVHRRNLFYGVDRLLVRAKAMAGRSATVRSLGRRLRPLLGGTLQRFGL